MRINELILELEFMGSPCTKDCSGHKAGYAWSQKHPMTPSASGSPSFNKGVAIAVNHSKPAVKPKVKKVLPNQLTPTTQNV